MEHYGTMVVICYAIGYCFSYIFSISTTSLPTIVYLLVIILVEVAIWGIRCVLLEFVSWAYKVHHYYCVSLSLIYNLFFIDNHPQSGIKKGSEFL